MWKQFIAVVVVVAVSFGPLLSGVVAAQTEAEIEAERARLKTEIVQKEIEIQKDRIKLMNQKEEREGYEEEAAALNAKIKQANLYIQKRSLAINALDYDIKDKENLIDDLDQKVRREEASLAQLLRKTHEQDNISFVELLLGSETFSEVFVDVDRFNTLKRALNISFAEISLTQAGLRSEQEELVQAISDQEELKMIQERQRQDIAADKQVQDSLASTARSKEEVYQETIKEKERTVAEIRAKLFALRDSNTEDVSFGTMLGYAQEASARTDVSPALILAILTVETNLGKTLGVGKWYEDMHPTRDVPVFKEIVAELGLNPDEMPISARPCSAAARKAAGPGNRCGYGYGGAMGPAQFIPSTWILYKDRIARTTGQNPPNPWDPRTAVFATALLMMDNGADAGTRNAEHKAAVRYLAGWRNAEKSEYWWYGDKTMRWRDQYATDIAALE
jgi:membrane-bound lytic murein transglycosylase B